MFWCLTNRCANNSHNCHKKHFTLYCLFLVVNRHFRPTFVLVTLLSWLTKIILRCFFFQAGIQMYKTEVLFSVIQNSRRYHHVCYKVFGAMLSLISKQETGRKQTSSSSSLTFLQTLYRFYIVSLVKQQSGTKIKLSVKQKKNKQKRALCHIFWGYFW